MPTLKGNIEILRPGWDTMKICDSDEGSQRTRKKDNEKKSRKGKEGGIGGREEEEEPPSSVML